MAKQRLDPGEANLIAACLECAGYARFSKADGLTPASLKQLENLAHEWVYYWKLEKEVGNEIPLRWLSTAEVRQSSQIRMTSSQRA